MRSLQLLIQEYPDKTGAEYLEIQAQEKAQEQAEIQTRNQKVLEFAEDLNTNGGYFKGAFGFDQRYMYKVTNVEVDEDGRVTGDVEKIVFHFQHDHKGGNATFNGKVEMSIRVDAYADLQTYGILYEDTKMLMRCTEEEYLKLKNYITNVDAEFFHDFIPDEIKVYTEK